ncbi:hypothetical protein KKHLCK_04590 [Candidatus Electrothrix laxa]
MSNYEKIGRENFCNIYVEKNQICENTEDICQHVKDIAYNLLSSYSEKFISLHIRKSPYQYYIKSNPYKRRSNPYLPENLSFNHPFPEYNWGRYDKNDLRKSFDNALDYLFIHDEFSSDFESNAAFSFLYDLQETWWNLNQCLFETTITRSSFTTGISSSNITVSNNRDYKLIEDLYYYVKTNLTNEVVYLPAPKNLREVISLRNRPEIISFREVLSEWCHHLENGEFLLEKKIRKDIIKLIDWSIKSVYN